MQTLSRNQAELEARVAERMRESVAARLNAIKYAEHGGIRVGLRVETENVWIDVMDTGPRIPDEHRQRLCDAFYQVAPLPA